MNKPTPFHHRLAKKIVDSIAGYLIGNAKEMTVSQILADQIDDPDVTKHGEDITQLENDLTDALAQEFPHFSRGAVWKIVHVIKEAVRLKTLEEARRTGFTEDFVALRDARRERDEAREEIKKLTQIITDAGYLIHASPGVDAFMPRVRGIVGDLEKAEAKIKNLYELAKSP